MSRIGLFRGTTRTTQAQLQVNVSGNIGLIIVPATNLS